MLQPGVHRGASGRGGEGHRRPVRSGRGQDAHRRARAVQRRQGQAAELIYSIGHGTRSIEEFVAILESAGIRRVVDVRTAPGSRKHPQFGQRALEAALRAEGIDYAWRKDLGGFRKPRPDSPHTALRSASFRGYADLMGSEEFDRSLRWLIDTSASTRTAFMCAESLSWRCHRRMIADALTARGRKVSHLMGRGRREPHPLHPNARVVGDELIYDVDDPDQQRLHT